MSEAMEVVKELNKSMDRIHDVLEEVKFYPEILMYTSNGYCEEIKYFGETIWDNDNSFYEYVYAEDDCTRLPLKDYIICRINEINRAMCIALKKKVK